MPIDSKLLAAGTRHYRSGAFEQAAEIFSQLLAADPKDAALQRWLGAAYLGLGRWSEAAVRLAEAIRLDPSLAAAHESLGQLHLAQRRFQEAAASFRGAAALEPRNVALQLQLAGALLGCEQVSEALEVLQHAARVAPDNLAARSDLARLLCEQNRCEEAVPHFRHVAELAPDDAIAHFELAGALAAVGQTTPAIAAYLAALKLKPEAAEGCAAVAKLFLEQKLYEEAELWSQRAVRLRPDFAEAFHNLGCALSGQKKYQQAKQALQTAIRLKPELSEAYNNLAVIYSAENRLDAALEQYRLALAVRPTNAIALCNLANAYIKGGDIETGIAHYDRAIALRPDYGEAIHNRAVAWLLDGHFEKGLPEFELRLKLKDFKGIPTQWKLWNGEPLAGRTIVLYREGGLGDTLQFVRYGALLKELGARVIVVCEPALGPILARTPGVDVWRTSFTEQFDADFAVMMMSMPARLNTTVATIPAPVPYVFADERLLEAWRARLAEIKDSHAGEAFKVGIVWQGNPQFLLDSQRSIPLASFAPLAQVPGVRLVSLQKGAGVEQLREFAEAWRVVDFGKEADRTAGAFMDTAAIMKNLDLVITSDTAAAHLAGALGVPVWLVLHRAPDWRWMLRRSDCPWYPTMRLFRQPQLGDWPGVFAQVAAELDRTVRESR